MTYRNIISGTGLLLAGVLALAVIIIANAIFTSARIDLTENRLFTLSEGSINIITTLEEPVNLDFYFSAKLVADLPQMRNYGNRVRDLLQEFAAKSNGNIKLSIIDPEPFSEQEDQAVASGLQSVSVNAAGDRAYFGLVGSNATDDEANVPFFQNAREAALEYDITKLIYALANPDKRVVGVISTLPLFGDDTGAVKPWTIVKVMRDFFEVRDLGTTVSRIAAAVDVLMLVHPKGLTETTLYAIDQYLLAGGKAIIFIDPMAEADTEAAQPDPANPYVMPEIGSDLQPLLETWGITMASDKLAADNLLAMRVQVNSQRGMTEADYLPWLRISREYLSTNDFSTSELKLVHVGTAGILQPSEESTLEFSPLIQTSTSSMPMERDLVLFQRDPNIMLANFKPSGEQQTLAARLSGEVKTAFPDGPVTTEEEDAADAPTTADISEGELNIILVADTDILADVFWTRTQNFFGIQIPQTIANNGDFVVNSLENLSGNTDLISLRSRGEFSRPFTRVEEIRREAEQQYRDREQQLQAKLDETERKIAALQKERGESNLLHSPEQAKEIESFRREQVKTRKELRAVKHELQKNIERLGNWLKFVNIFLIPLLITLIALLALIQRSRRSA
ncbi:MAG: Gldg family protein [Gammaproteobacteria bacterium]